MTNQRVLVLMSSYNGEKYIEEQILSIMNQESEYQIDLWIRDDGSTDDTCNVIAKTRKAFPGRIKLIKGERLGYNGGFIFLLNQARDYTFYALSDQDDVWLSNKIQVACEKLRKEDNTIPLLYASTSLLVKDDLKPFGTTRKQRRELSIFNTIVQNICPGHTQVLNNALLNLFKELVIDIHQIYVYDSWIMNLANLYGKIIFNNEPFALYRQHQENQLGSGAGAFGRIQKIIKRSDNGDGLRYRKQIEYFIKCNKNELVSKGVFSYLNEFISAKSLKDRIILAFHGKLYRQSRFETLLLYIAILLGKY